MRAIFLAKSDKGGRSRLFRLSALIRQSPDHCSIQLTADRLAAQPCARTPGGKERSCARVQMASASFTFHCALLHAYRHCYHSCMHCLYPSSHRCAKPAVPILSTSPVCPRHPNQATLHMQGCPLLIASTRHSKTMPYTPARLPRSAAELHKTLRPRIHKPNSSQQPGPTASLRAALVWSKEKDELMIACAQGDVNKGAHLPFAPGKFLITRL